MEIVKTSIFTTQTPLEVKHHKALEQITESFENQIVCFDLINLE